MSEPKDNAKSNELIFRACLKHNRSPEFDRLCALSSALETAGHALYTVLGLLKDEDFGDTLWEELEAIAAPLLKKAEAIRARNEALSKGLIAEAKAEMKWEPPE